MLKNELFIAAMNEQLYKSKPWVISAFSLFIESEDAWRKNPYPLHTGKEPQPAHPQLHPTSVWHRSLLTAKLSL